MTEPVTEPAPPPDPDETVWDPQGEQLAAVAVTTETSDALPRGGQHLG